MAVSITNIISNMDTYIGDTSTDRISTAERYQCITEATAWLQEELGNDHLIATYELNYLDNIHYYKITAEVATLLEGADLRRDEKYHDVPFTYKSPRELSTEILSGAEESSWSIERKDDDCYLIVSHNSLYSASTVSNMDSLTIDGGTWAADTSTSDALNLTVDTNEMKEGSGSLNFDIDVSQSGNNRATISNSTLDSLDLSTLEDLGSWVFWVYVPDTTNFSSVTLYWGSDTSNYWSATATTDANGNAYANGWNRVKIDWADATMTSTPDASAIDFIRFDFNYGAGQGDDTDFRIDELTIVRPEKLTFFYTSWKVGETSGGTALTAFTSGTDVPFFSGKYDQYKYAVAHKAASIAFYGPLRNSEQGSLQEAEALKSIQRQRNLFPKSATKEERTFKPAGLNFSRRRRR